MKTILEDECIAIGLEFTIEKTDTFQWFSMKIRDLNLENDMYHSMDFDKCELKNLIDILKFYYDRLD